MPDLLSGVGPKGGGTSDFGSIDDVRNAIPKLPPEQVTADLNAAAAYVAKDPACNGKVAVAGFCWGGGQAFRFATNNKDVKAAFVFYGVPPRAGGHGADPMSGIRLLRRQRRPHHHDGSQDG